MAKHDNRKKGYGVSGLIGGKKSAINRYALRVKNDERYKELCSEVTIRFEEPKGILRPHLSKTGKKKRVSTRSLGTNPRSKGTNPRNRKKENNGNT